VLIIALGVPLTVNLQRRATTELTTQALLQAQGIAAQIGRDNIDEPARLDQIVTEAAAQVGGRVLVVNDQGFLVADSDGAVAPNTPYATPGRPEIQRALEGTPFSQIRDSLDLGHDIMATAVPIQDEERLLGAVRITRSVQGVNDNIRNITFGLAAIGTAALAAGMLLAFGLAGSLSRPLTRLAAAAKRLGHGDLSARAGDVGGAREVEELGQSFDEMADRLERSAQAQREFVANASHQLRTPLTAMRLRLEGAIAEAPNDAVRQRLEAAELEVDRLSGIVDRLLMMAREIEEGTSANVDLSQAVDRAVLRWNERAGQRDSTVVRRETAGLHGSTRPTSTRSSTTCSTTRPRTRRARSPSNRVTPTAKSSSPCGTGDRASRPRTSRGSPNASIADAACRRAVRDSAWPSLDSSSRSGGAP
jgi:signal transduction histidine kinase